MYIVHAAALNVSATFSGRPGRLAISRSRSAKVQRSAVAFRMSRRLTAPRSLATVVSKWPHALPASVGPMKSASRTTASGSGGIAGCW